MNATQEKQRRSELWQQMMSQSFDPREWFDGRDWPDESQGEDTIMWVFKKLDSGRFEVGFYSPDKRWMPEGDYADKGEAAGRVHYLNGGKLESAAVATATVHEAAVRGYQDRGHGDGKAAR